MKLWRIIWAMYVLVLSGLPCEAFCQDEPAIDQTTRSASNDHKHEAGCSAFCLCATCPGFTMPPSVRLVQTVPSVASLLLTALPPYQAPHAMQIMGQIWQPPRLS